MGEYFHNDFQQAAKVATLIMLATPKLDGVFWQMVYRMASTKTCVQGVHGTQAALIVLPPVGG